MRGAGVGGGICTSQELARSGKKLSDYIEFRLATLCPDIVYQELNPVTGEHYTIAGQPSKYYTDALQMGHGGIPLLDDWNRRALGLFCELFTGFFKEFGYVGAEEYAARDILVESNIDARALRSAWAQLYRFFNDYELRKSELERTQRGR